jgi:glycosyltransferase involved in cell wall biosynthesis
MHIAHLEAGRHLYGGARQVLHLMRGLRAQGVAGTLVCPPGSAIAAEAGRHQLDVLPVALGGELDFLAGMRIARALGGRGCDLLHVHSRRGAEAAGRSAARRRGIPAIVTRRVDNPLSRLAAARRFRSFSRIVVISGAVRNALLAAGVRPERLALIPSAVDAALLDPPWSRQRLAREFGLDPAAPLVVSVAQLIPRKGHSLLLEAWREVASALPDARLVVIGQGSLASKLRAEAQRRGVADSVVFAGWRGDLGEFIGRFDLLVHTALHEGLGLAILEAQGAGVPVVAFRAGGIPEAVVDGQTGILVPTGDAAALAGALRALLSNPAARQQMGEAAWERAARAFRVADMVAAHLTLYRDVLETAAP